MMEDKLTEWDGVQLSDMSKEQLISVCQALAATLAQALNQAEALQRQFAELSQMTTEPVKREPPRRKFFHA